MCIPLGGSQDPEQTEDQEPGCRGQNQTRDSKPEAVPPSAHYKAVPGHQHPHRHIHGHGVRRRLVQNLFFHQKLVLRLDCLVSLSSPRISKTLMITLQLPVCENENL